MGADHEGVTALHLPSQWGTLPSLGPPAPSMALRSGHVAAGRRGKAWPCAWWREPLVHMEDVVPVEEQAAMWQRLWEAYWD